MCFFLWGLVEDVWYDEAPRCRDARFMLENHLGKIDDVQLECKPAPKGVHSRTPRTTGHTRIIRLVAVFALKA